MGDILTPGLLPVYLARKKRTEWPEKVRMDPEIKLIDPGGEWIICRTCTELYEKTHKGRKPNDPLGFKVKMNAKYQEAAWHMHKSRVGAHKRNIRQELNVATVNENFLRDQELVSMASNSEPLRISGLPRPIAKRQKVASSGSDRDDDTDDVGHISYDLEGDGTDGGMSASGPFFMEEMKFDEEIPRMVLPRTGWKCPGIVPDSFYHGNAELVHAFAKYYVGSYRINVVRDIRSDKVMLFSHDCQNKTVQRDRLSQPISCDKCYDIWSNNKSFKRILKKMDRYNMVEEVLRHGWSLTDEQLTVLSNFKHLSGSNLNLEGRKLKQAAIMALRKYKGNRKMPHLIEKPLFEETAHPHHHHQHQRHLQQQHDHDEDELELVSATLPPESIVDQEGLVVVASLDHIEPPPDHRGTSV